MGSRDRDRSRERSKRSRRSRSRSRSRSRDRRRGRSRSRDRRRRSRSRSSYRSRSKSRSRERTAGFSSGTAATSVADTVQALQHQQLQRQLLQQQLLLQQQALAQMTTASSNKKQREIYVGNLTIGAVSEVMLRELFNGALGMLVPDPVLNPPVVGVTVDATGRFAFVEFRTEELATHAIQLDKLELLGRPINIGRPKGYVEPSAAAVANQARLSMASMGMLGGAGATTATLGLGAAGLAGAVTLPGASALPSAGVASLTGLAGLTAGAAPTAAAPAVGGVSQVSPVPTNVVLLQNLLLVKDVRDDKERNSLLEEVSAECGGYGRVMATAVPKPPAHVSDETPCRVYVKFSNAAEAASCSKTMDGRLFDGNRIKAVYVSELDFNRALNGEWMLHLGA